MSKLAPTLIVGLGGVGSQITEKLSAMITDPKQQERINFVVLDTDINELRKIERESSNGRGKKVITIQTSTNMTVGDYLHLDSHTRENSFPVNPNLYRKTLSEGAGQVRAISHLAFVTAMKRGLLNPLDEAIYDLYKLESVPSTQVLRVIIVSTLAGGTGSGLILPVSMYIKQFLKTKIQIPGSITRGFFILPEILYGAVTTEPMRNAFRANAYAVLRELNAFILKADNNLPERYKDKVKLEFPKVGTNEFEEYDVLPMDFSFMFDAQNIEGKKLNSTAQYLQHAATCIYAQSIGPMNTRSNSSEDNVIRTLVAGKSQNRYAGAGASELVYPSDHVLKYIALKWATNTVSQQWTVFDRDYEKSSKENNRARLKGHNPPDLVQAEEYIRSVDALEKNDNSFAAFTRNASYNFDKDGYTEIGPKWNKYIDELYKFVQSMSVNNEMDSFRNSVQSTLDTLRQQSGEKIDEEQYNNDFMTAYSQLTQYKELVKQRIGDIGKRAAFALFKSNDGEDVTLEKKVTQVETYLRDSANKYMHPNCIRYFLYQTLDALKKKTAENDKKKTNAENLFKNFDNLFDVPGTGETETINDVLDKIRNKGFLAKIKSTPAKDLEEYVKKYTILMNTIKDYRVIAPFEIVLKAAQEYVESLSRSFEMFYKSFDSNVADIERRIRTSEEKYSLKKGNTIRYVCSSKKCLDKFYEKMEFTGSVLQIPEELCMRIYNQVRKHSLIKDKDNQAGTFFKDIFDNEIIKHFETSVMETYSTDIKMDIIRALETEAEYEEGKVENSQKIEYVKKVIKDTKTLANPFINRPVGEEPVTIDACAFNKKLYRVDDRVDSPEREELVRSELKSFGGCECEDDEIESEKVLFYSAIYGLYPADLLKFSPPQKGETVTLVAGEYNKSYYDMIKRIEPDLLKTPVITPHLHKWWHLISEMPDLNERLQEAQEKTIFKALVLGILYNRIRYEKDGDRFKYSLRLTDSIEETSLVLQDGMKCDNFYQIVDALTINQAIIEKIFRSVEIEIENAQRNNVIKFEQSKLYKGIVELKLPELSKSDRTMSIFGIAAAFKATMPPDKFILKQGLMLLEIILETIYEQMEILCPENERGTKYTALIKQQLNLFESNFELYRTEWPSVLDNYLRDLLQVVISVLTRKKFIEAANEVDEETKHLFFADIKSKSKAEKKDDGQK